MGPKQQQQSSQQKPRGKGNGGGGNGNGDAPKSGSSPSTEDLSGPLTAKEVDQNRERFLLVLSDMTGHHVNVTLLNGTSFKAIFHTVSDTRSPDFTYVFKAAKGSTGGYTTKMVASSEVLEVSIEAMTLKEAQPTGGGSKGFATDTDISKTSASHLVDRDLAEVNSAWLDASLESESEMRRDDSAAKWDQFEANYKLTGKMATFDESQYTTKLDMSNVGESQADAAAKLAAEIEGAAGESVHAAEERGQKVDLKGLTEEDLYSGVARTTEPKKEEPKKKLTLSATAKAFVPNPNAKEFVPGQFSAPAAPAPAAPAPAPSYGGKGGKNYSGKGGGGGYGGYGGGGEQYGGMYPQMGAGGMAMGGPGGGGFAVMPGPMVGGAYGQAGVFPRGPPMVPGGGGGAPGYAGYGGGFLQVPGGAAPVVPQGGLAAGGYMAAAGGAYYPAMGMPQGAMPAGGGGGVMYAPGQQGQRHFGGSGDNFDGKKKRPPKGKEWNGAPPTQPPRANDSGASGDSSGPPPGAKPSE